MINIYSISYNEEIIIQFMIDHYRKRFPNCNITIYDNSSTDRTVEIAKANNCNIINYQSGGKIDDALHMDIKNNCWKNASTDWVLVCDMDELLDINEEQLKEEENLGNSKIKAEGWSMVNLENNLDINNIKYGVREDRYDKDVLFNKKYIKEINYGAGAHDCNSIGNIKYSKPYKLYHYKYINVELEVLKSKTTAQRLSDNNIKNGWGLYTLRSEQEVRDFFKGMQDKAIKLL